MQVKSSFRFSICFVLMILMILISCSSDDSRIPTETKQEKLARLRAERIQRRDTNARMQMDSAKPVAQNSIAHAKLDSVSTTTATTPVIADSMKVVSQAKETDTFKLPMIPTYSRQKNTYWQHCKYKEIIEELLYAELQETLTKNNKPLSYYNQWFLDLHDPEYTTDEILKYYESKIAHELGSIYRFTYIDYSKAWLKQPCVKQLK